MNSTQLRKTFQEFFKSKEHSIVSSAPMVIKNDPTLMFTNAGMNQFKDIFLGNKPASYNRVANSQKCLRVSGKHNDLEEVGKDTYHHTMFEMLGNWSFGDYFKKEAIEWAFEFLVKELNIPKDRLYATIFEGSKEEGLDSDKESENIWKAYLPEDRILLGSKKDNFWEMGDTGPCGPCSEIHIDIRPQEEREIIPGRELVNKDHPQLIEIWNLVFIQFNRLSTGKLETLPLKHVDTGMGFERLCMVVQGKNSNYDTDVFQSIIGEIAKLTNKKYSRGDSESDIAMRVIADHLRAVSFSIAEGQLPSNNKAGYVIRRILRRAIRYSYSFLDQTNPFIYKLVPVLSGNLGKAFPELLAQKSLISKVIKEEEASFLKTLERGIELLQELVKKAREEKQSELNGTSAFELYDTYGFPLDLTELILQEHGLKVNKKEFEQSMLEQKSRSRKDGKLETGDWIELRKEEEKGFVGYHQTEIEIHITRYRKISQHGEDMFQLVFNTTPFYAESGGQVGDIGIIQSDEESIDIIDTQKENDLIVHIAGELPAKPEKVFIARVNSEKRDDIANNHTATHLLHEALREVLGSHVEQKGSLVDSEALRFDFSHFQKLSNEELDEIERKINARIRANLTGKEEIIPYDEAIRKGAIALFGEKYTDRVRTIQFGNSVELCGGTHVKATGNIGIFKIVSESSVAAGIRRIEAVSGTNAEKYISNLQLQLRNIQSTLKGHRDIEKAVLSLVEENLKLRQDSEALQKAHAKDLKNNLIHKHLEKKGDISLIIQEVQVQSPSELKDLAFKLRNQVDMLFGVLGSKIDGKAHLAVVISDALIKNKNINAGEIIKNISKEIKGGGGGQAFLATAGGKDPSGIQNALKLAREYILGFL